MAWRLTLVLVASAAVFASPALAQQITVRSGEHDGFSRLAVDLPKRTSWKVSGDGKGREIRLGADLGELNFDKVFTRLSEGRISDIGNLPQTPGLQLEMTCDCTVDVGWHGESMLVIDVRGQARSGAEADLEGPLSTDRSAAEVLPRKSSELAAAALANPQGTAGHLASLGMRRTEEAISQAETMLLEEARVSIARDISKAATSGLLSVDPTLLHSIETEAAGDSSTDFTDPMPALDSERTPPTMNFETTKATQILRGGGGVAQTADGYQCLNDDLIDVANWGANLPFTQQIGPARQRISGELDRYDPQAAIALARLYLFFGFGKEAAQVVQVAQLDAIEAKAVVAMAEIIEHEQPNVGLFQGQNDCDSQVALWSSLSGSEGMAEQPPNTDAILRTLSGYPGHLRALIGPRLARSLVSRGRQNEAARILRILDRQPSLITDEQNMARANLDGLSGSKDVSNLIYEDIVENNGEFSAEALVELIWDRIERGPPLEVEVLDLLESHIQEQRGTQLYPQLQNTRVAALAALGHFDTAVSALRNVKEKADHTSNVSEYNRALDVVMSRLVDGASDLTFLKFFLATDKKEWAAVSAKTSLGVARRLHELGFSDIASLYLTVPQAPKAIDAYKTLQADIYLAKALPRVAISSLSGVLGSEADILRARSFRMMGDHRSARSAYLAAGDLDAAKREALFIEGWSDENQAADLVDPVVDDAINELGANDEGGQLQQGALLLQESIDMRLSIGRSLSEIGLPTENGGL